VPSGVAGDLVGGRTLWRISMTTRSSFRSPVGPPLEAAAAGLAIPVAIRGAAIIAAVINAFRSLAITPPSPLTLGDMLLTGLYEWIFYLATKLEFLVQFLTPGPISSAGRQGDRSSQVARFEMRHQGTT
jgi:hypothetical protein